MVVPKILFCPRAKDPPRGQNGLKTHAPNDREDCQSVCYKILLEGTQGIGIEPFSQKNLKFPINEGAEGPPKNEILPKNQFFPILYTLSFLRCSIYSNIFSDFE